VKSLSGAVVASVLIGAPCISLADAEQAVQRLSQYGHASWHVQDGLFSSPNSITQTKDGYIWIGTDAGLVRFDGVRFVPWNAFQDGNNAGRAVDAVFAASDGSLWVGAGRQVAQLQDSRINRYEVPGRVMQFVEDRAGTILIGQTRVNGRGGPACQVAAGKLACFGRPDLALDGVSSMSAATEHGLWLGGSSGLCHWSPGTVADCYLAEALAPLTGLVGVSAILSAKNGTLWVGIEKAGHDLGLGQLEQGKWKPFVVPGLDGRSLAVSSVLEDREGSVWVGTLDQGLYRVRGTAAEHFGQAEGLSSNSVAAGGLYEDREGTVWVATAIGLDSFRHLPVSVFSTREGLPADGVESVLPARDGTVWFGNLAVSILSNGESIAPLHPELFAGRSATSLLQDHAQRLWIGLDKTLNVFEKGTLKPISSPSGGPLGIVQFIAEDSAHDVWAVTAEENPQIFRIRNLAVKDQIRKDGPRPIAIAPDPSGGIWIGYPTGAIASYRDNEFQVFAADNISKTPVTALLVTENGTLLGSTLNGLLIQRGGSRQLLNIDHGLPCDRLRTLVRDAHNSIWMLGNCGLIEIGDSDLERWLKDPSAKIQYHLLEVTDGVQPGYGSFSPSAALGPDGRVWFATGKVAQVVDPTTLERARAPPPLRIETITVDRKVLYPESALALPARSRDIEIRYTALSFVAPQRIRFKYQLQGHDETWIDAGTRRAAFYNDLPPGSYLFTVIASNSDGIWSNEGASLGFEIPPAFYQTRWFIVACTIAVMMLLYLGYLLRLRQVAARIRVRLVAKNAERERIARELHDTLLQSTQGLVLRFQAATKQLPPDNSVRASLELVLQRANEVVAEGRDRVQDLRTSDALSRNLVQSLSAVGEELAREYRLQFSVVLEGHQQDLKPLIREETYAIGREALRNAFTHAHARLVELQVIYSDDDFRLRCRDDGRGIDASLITAGRPGRFGLKGMRERAQKIGAQFDIWSRPNAGTELELQIPARVAYAKARSRFRWLRWRLRSEE